MIIENILTPARTLYRARGNSKKKILELIATIISVEVSVIDGKELFSSLISRERLGTTGLGNGFALPHCRNKYCKSPAGVFIRLAEPVDFDAIDKQPVDLVFALVVPEEKNPQLHLDILKALAHRFQSNEFMNKLRTANNLDELYGIIISSP